MITDNLSNLFLIFFNLYDCDFLLYVIVLNTFRQNDALVYTWEKVGGELPSNAQFSDFNRLLFLPNVQRVNEGEYRCTVRNRYQSGSDSSSVQIRIDGTFA